jgi:hypothetical protein
MSMLRKLETACRAVFAWKPLDEHALSASHLIERNEVTGAYRWCERTPPRGLPDPWKPGLPSSKDLRPAPPSGGSSGVKPRSPEHKRNTEELIKTIDEHVAAFAKHRPTRAPAEDKPFHRLSIAKMPDGGFTVSEHHHDPYRGPLFRLRFAGNITDALEFIRVDMLRERGEEEA